MGKEQIYIIEVSVNYIGKQIDELNIWIDYRHERSYSIVEKRLMQYLLCVNSLVIKIKTNKQESSAKKQFTYKLNRKQEIACDTAKYCGSKTCQEKLPISECRWRDNRRSQ